MLLIVVIDDDHLFELLIHYLVMHLIDHLVMLVIQLIDHLVNSLMIFFLLETSLSINK
jgi:hypothetical protein